MSWLLALHAVLALGLISAQRRIGRWAFLVGAIGPLAVLGWVLAKAGQVMGGTPYEVSVAWVPSLDLVLDFKVDAYALLFLLVVGVAGVAIFLYSARYFGSGPRATMFAGTMTGFAGAMVGLVSADHLLAVFLFWELTTITSYLLIGYANEKAEARSAALQAALVTGAGGLALLAGLVLLGNEVGDLRISEIVANPPAASITVSVAWVLVLIGAATKSAQFPFHGWLPAAMAAPTPASAFLHAAAMVMAGVFLVGRLSPSAVASTEWWTGAIVTVGFVTMVVGGWRALRQHDLKLLLALGTVSQLGFLFLLFGAGIPELLFGGLALITAHAMFKAALFLVVGTIDHEAGTRDLRRLSGLRKSMPAVFWAGTLAAASMAAVPLTFGFVAKEAVFDSLFGIGPIPIFLAAAASVLTVTYTGRFLVGAFGRHHEGYDAAGVDVQTPRNALTWAPLGLAVAGVVLGLFPAVLLPLIDGATLAVFGAGSTGKLVVWPGFVPALGWSLASLGIGSFLVLRPGIVDRATQSLARVTVHLPTAEGSFRKSLAALLRFAKWSSGLIQNGSLPTYLAIIALVAVLLPSTAFIGGGPKLVLPRAGGVLELMLGVVVVVSAVAIAFSRRRFAAVILLGGVGYGIAGLFALLSGPDLSITQVLVETLVIALFALVLRHMPMKFTMPRPWRVSHLVIAVLVASFVFVGGLLTSAERVGDPVSDFYLEASVSEAGGANVVNVILVDFRALDTLGEIAVFVAATMGAASLVLPYVRRKRAET